MKPSSIIFLVISVLIIIGGVVLCTVGMNMASEQGVAMFKTNVVVSNGDVVATDVFDASQINKIKMSLDDVKVYIAPSETGESYLEMYNFQVGTYDYSIQNKMLVIDSGTSLFSLMRIAEGNFNFSGLRHFLMYRPNTGKEKKLYLYLAEDAEINVYDISVESGEVTVRDLATASDYNITLETGNITLENISTKSAVNLSTDKGVVKADGLQCRMASIVIGSGAADLYVHQYPSELQVTVMDGDIVCGYSVQTEYGLLFEADAAGQISYNGTLQEARPWKYSSSPGVCLQEFQAKNGNIELSIRATGASGRFDELSESLGEETEGAAE
ncbi:MAG: DUF4097 family beta strand repeat protein [Clostridia bacterium]|nr:DUF4097 family beta strand repeat protein [Clostridia bacterium]